MHVKVSLKEITDNGVVMKRLTGNGREFSLEGDYVVVMAGFAPENKLYETLREKGWKVFPVGDCVEPRKIHEAIYEGHIAGRKVG